MSSLTQVNCLNIYENVLKSLLEKAARSALPDWAQVEQSLKVSRVEQGGTVFMQDASHPYVYAVRSGLIKLMYLSENGDEWIKSFVPEGGFFASISALSSGGRTNFMAIALEPCVLEQVDYRVLAGLAQTHIAWSHAMHSLTLVFASRKEQRERELLTLNAESRYLAFKKEQPQLERRIPQKDLARYLGLTPVGLNRIVMRVRREV